MPVITLHHDGCEPWVVEVDSDEQGDALAAAWPGWSRDPAEQAPAATVAASETPAPAPVDVPAPAGPLNSEGA